MEIDSDFLNLAWYLAAGAGLLLFLVIALWMVRSLMPYGGVLTRGRDRRLVVTDQTPVDGRRRLVLVRRDDVEHLIMTGGPIDLVIETGINGNRARSLDEIERGSALPPEGERIRLAGAETEYS